MPKVQTTRVFSQIEKARSEGYSTVSEQGSSRSGKTWNTVLWICVYAFTHPNTTISVVRQTLPSLKRSVYRDFEANMINLGFWDRRCMNKSEFIYHFDNGSWIEFFSADDEQKLRGSKRKILYVNEGNELTFLEWQQLQMRTTEFSIIDYNPSFSEDHWICQSLNRDPRTYHFISTYKDNPFLEQKVIEEIESLQTKNPSLWRVYGLGLQAIIEGLIFENVEEIEEIPRWAEKHRFLGIDFGYTNDPTAIVEVCIYDNALYIDEVAYATHMKTSDIVEAFKKKQRESKFCYEIVSESADPRLIDEIYEADLDIHPVHKYGGSVMAGITKMLEYKIYVTKRSVNIKKEFHNYTYRQDKAGNWLNEPIDAFNHCFTADTEVITMCGNKCISDVVEGDYVLTSRGFRKVGRVFTHRRQKICEYTIKSGRFEQKIKATPNHYVKTDRGWKQLQELQPGMTIYQFKSSMAKNITYTAERGTIQEVQNGCTLLCGNTTMDQSRTGITFITKMATLLTTASTTFKRLLNPNISSIMRNYFAKIQDTKSGEERTAIQSDHSQKRGMAQKKEGDGTQYMEDWLRCQYSQRNVPVSSAEMCLTLKRRRKLNSAPMYAKASGEENKVLITKQEPANCAEKSLLSTSTQEHDFVQAVVLESITSRELPDEDVYDLHVDGVHEYFANGILVHNCIDAIRYVCLEKLMGDYESGLDAGGLLDIL